MDLHEKMMRHALELAHKAASLDEVPVGAVVYDDNGTIWGEGHNRTIMDSDPTAHAELVALRAACAKRQSPIVADLHLAVTLEPCAMCAQALSWARIKTLRFGAWDVKSGGTINGARVFNSDTCHHKPEVFDGMLEEPCRAIMQKFFEGKRHV